MHRYREVCQSPARSETPCAYTDTSRGNREIPCSPKERTYDDDERTWEVL
jgi:hypothetical protein